jgi:erythromycin esterase-like protein
MGSLLSNALGDSYRVVGSAFHHGTFLAMPGQIAEAQVARVGALEHLLHQFGTERCTPNFLIDFRSESAPWAEGLRMNIGEAGSPRDYEETFLPQQPQQQFDALVYVSETSPTTVLEEYYGYENSTDASV